MAKSKTETLWIRWQMPSPPADAKRWVEVQTREMPGSPVEGILGFPSGTVGYLNHAFERGLGRFDGWTLKEDSPSAKAAASIYKRGVSCRVGKIPGRQELLKGNYEILFSKANKAQELLNTADNFFIVDKKVADLWPEVAKLEKSVVIETSELEKNLSTVAKIFEAGKKHPKWTIVGGGVLSDVAAFAAAIAKKPVNFIPTTLLAMADACVGGKTGVNHEPYGKNQVGAFYFPTEVVIWDGWLKTLPKTELLAGASECFKHAFLNGDLTMIKKLQYALQSMKEIQDILPRIVEFKAKIVAEDPNESGKRAILNFGHTMGHALEIFSQRHNPKSHLIHGEAIAYGMVFASLLSLKTAGMPKEDFDMVVETLKGSGCVGSAKELCKKLGIPAFADKAFREELKSLLTDDKKVADGHVNWILLSKLGMPYVKKGKYGSPLNLSVVDKTLDEFLAVL